MQEPPDLTTAEVERLVGTFRLLGDPGRLRLVAALLEDRELPVGELSRAARLSDTATSQHLRLLHEAGVVRRRRVGRQILYRLHGGDARAFARTAVARAALRSSQPPRPTATYIIAEPCIDVKDKACLDACPVDCIHEVDRMLVIDPDECIECGACEPACPVEAIYRENAVPEKWESFVTINHAYRDGLNTVNELVTSHIGAHPPKRRKPRKDGAFER